MAVWVRILYNFCTVIFLTQTIFCCYTKTRPYRKVFRTHPNTSRHLHKIGKCFVSRSKLMYGDHGLWSASESVKLRNRHTHTHIHTDKNVQPRGMAWPVPATTIENSKFQSPGMSSKLCKAELLSENVYFMTDEQPYFQGLWCQRHSMFAKNQPITQRSPLEVHRLK